MAAEQRRHGEPVRNGTESERAGSLHARKTLVVGLTGGIATGKTTVARMFGKLGAKVISADEIVHRMLQPGTDVARAVVREFGEGVVGPGGVIDRKKLGEIVFKAPERRRRLEAITHPAVIEQLGQEAQRFRAGGEGVLILEIPLLTEASCQGLVDKVLVVTAEQDTQAKRLEKRYGIGREEAVLRIQAQLPVSEKAKHAHWVISTEGTVRSTERRVGEVWDSIQKRLALQR